MVAPASFRSRSPLPGPPAAGPDAPSGDSRALMRGLEQGRFAVRAHAAGVLRLLGVPDEAAAIIATKPLPGITAVRVVARGNGTWPARRAGYGQQRHLRSGVHQSGGI